MNESYIYYIYILNIYIYIHLKMNRRKILEHLRTLGAKLKTNLTTSNIEQTKYLLKKP